MISFEIIFVMAKENAILIIIVQELLDPKKMFSITLMKQKQIVRVPYLDKKKF